MGFRYRKSIKIASGVRLNLSKKSVGLSVGGKGFHHTVNSSGRQTTTVGIPGTGMSYSHASASKSSVGKYNVASAQGNDEVKNVQVGYSRIALYVLLGAGSFFCFLKSSHPVLQIFFFLVLYFSCSFFWLTIRRKIKAAKSFSSSASITSDAYPQHILDEESLKGIVFDCHNIIAATHSLDIFLSRYDLLIGNIEQIADSDALTYAIQNYSSSLAACVMRCLADCESMQTKRGKANRIRSFIGELDRHQSTRPELVKGKEYARSLLNAELEKVQA